MKRLSFIALALLLLASICRAQDQMTNEDMIVCVRGNLAAFNPVKMLGDGVPAQFKTRLGETTATFKDKFIFDGVRFTAPEKLEGLDFIWYFNAPSHWGNWFIIPAESDFEGGFGNWLDGDKLYREFDIQGEKNRLRVLQSLAGSYFKPGKDYILWFRKVGEGDPSELRGLIAFASKPGESKEWDHATIERALKLKPSPAAEQGKELGSRGATILLDEAFFDRSEAEDRIDQVFFDLRQTHRFRGGYFITTEISCPPCRKKPSLALIRKKYGEADIIVTGEESARVAQHAGGSKTEDKTTVTHFYDYFGFEVAADDPKEKVQCVITQASNFADVRPPDDAPFFGRVPMKNLIVFQNRKKEVGRMYYFLEGGKEALGVQVPPVGKYRSSDEVLEYQGDGRWLWQTLKAGKIMRSIPLENHKMNGRAEGFFENGRQSFVANYKNGVLDGEVVEYAGDGKVLRKQMFRNGKRDPEDKGAKAPQK